MGRRTKKVANGKIKRYLWDGNVLLHEWEYDVADEPQLLTSEIGEVSFNRPEPINNLITWVYENGSFVPIGKLTQNESFSIVSDYLGTPVQAYDEEGNLVWERELDIYGKVKTETRESANFVPFRYQGQYYDSEVDLCYNRFRYYSPEIGTYISQDPIGLAGNNPNFYVYVFDSNTQVDVFGLDCSKIKTKAITEYYPPNGGALGKREREFLMPGTKIDRSGSGFGKYFSPYNTPMIMRALPEGNTGNYNAFVVVKPFDVFSSTIAPAFGKIGLGKQYLSPVNMNTLLKRGIIKPLKL